MNSPDIAPDDIAAAHRLIAPHVRRTPVIEIAGSELGVAGRLALKLELLQHTGSFKPRGAFVSLLTGEVPEAGVVAASGGNHGAAVAYAAARLGIRVRIFVPEIAAPAKIAHIRAHGGNLTVTGANYAEALAASKAWTAQSGARPIHAYDQRETLLGQGTVAAEFDQQVPGTDTVLVAVGGGGLIGGMAAWYAGRVRLVGVEPRNCPSLHAARAAGRPVDVEVSGIAADSLGARRVGSLMYPIAERHVADVVLVDDEAITEARRLLWDRLRIAAEPGGAAALAALVSGAYRPATDERVGIVICGGNADAPAVTP